MSYSQVDTQASMALDEVRNKAYLEALKSVITPESVVVDIGAGMGPFGFLAAKLGARKVYLIEPEAVINTLDKVAADNGVADRVECIRGKAENVDIGERVDVITSCFTGNFLLTENLLPSLFRARDKFLKEGGVLLPSLGRSFAVPITLAKKHEDYIGCYLKPHLGIDYSYFRKYGSNQFHRVRDLAVENYLSEPQQVLELDFYTANEASYDHKLSFEVSVDGVCHGFAGWFDMLLNDQILSTGPSADKVHWAPLWFPIEQPQEVKKGDVIDIQIKRPQGGSYMWAVDCNGNRQVQTIAFQDLMFKVKKPHKK